MVIENAELFDFLILIFGGILIILLGFLFYQLAFQKMSVSPTGIEKKKEKQIKQNIAEKSVVKKNDHRPAPGQVLKTKEAGATTAASPRMPDLLSLGIKDNKPPVFIQTQENHAVTGGDQAKSKTNDADIIAAAIIEATSPLPGVQKEKDVVNALNVFGGQTGNVSSPSNDGKILSQAQASMPAVVPPAPISPPPPVMEKAKEKKAESLMSMFADEEVEETESNKVAKNLEQVDIHDLLEESQSLINNLIRRG